MKVKPTINSTTATGSHTSQGGKKQKKMTVQFALLIMSALLLAACSSGLEDAPEIDAAASTKKTESRISSDQGDAEEKVSGRVIVNSRDLELGYEGKGRQIVGLRFEDVEVPRGASIKRAYIKFEADQTDTARIKVRIRAEDANDADAFSTSKNNLSKRSKTSASVGWQIDGWKKRGERSSKQRTPDLDKVVEEVTSRKGWDSGNSMVFMIGDSNSDRKRVARSYKGSEKGAPVLHIEYSGGKSDSSDNAKKKKKKPTDSGPKVDKGDADYYVSPKNGSDSNDGSRSKPFETIQKVSEVVRPGDTVFLRGGTYKGRGQSYMQWTHKAFTKDGKKGKRITIMSYPGERAVIDGSDISYKKYRSLSSPIALPIKGNYYTIRDITIKNSAGRGLYISGDNNIVENVTSYNNHSDGIYVKGDDNLIEDFESYGNYSKQNGGDSADGIKLVAGDGNIVRNCRLDDNSDDGIDSWDTTNTLIENCSASDNGYGKTGNGRGYKVGGAGKKNTGTVVRENKADGNLVNFDTNGSTGILLEGNVSRNPDRVHYVIQRGNKASDNKKVGSGKDFRP